MRCHWTHDHDPHPWTPLVVDPDNPGVMHIFTDAPIICPGTREEDQ